MFFKSFVICVDGLFMCCWVRDEFAIDELVGCREDVLSFIFWLKRPDCLSLPADIYCLLVAMELESDVSSDEAPSSPGMLLELASDVSEDDVFRAHHQVKSMLRKG